MNNRIGPLVNWNVFGFWTISEICKYSRLTTGLEVGPIRVVCSCPVKLSNSTVGYKFFFAPPQQNLCTCVATTAWWLSTWGWYQHYTTISEEDPNKTMSTRPQQHWYLEPMPAAPWRFSIQRPSCDPMMPNINVRIGTGFQAWQDRRLPLTKILWAVVGMKL